MLTSIVSMLLLISGFVATNPLNVARTSSSIAGATYFMTNDPSGNNVIVSAIDSYGKLSFANAVATGGKGLHGNNTGVDGLFSQDSVVVGHKMLFVVNAGSNTLTMFNINHLNPTEIHMAGQPVNSGGEFPVSVAFSKKTSQVCVLNGGKVNGVSCYWANRSKGLIPIKDTIRSLGLPQTTPATGPPGTVSDIIFSPDGESLLVSVKGTPPTPGFIATFTVNKSTGSLSDKPVKTTPAAGGVLPFSITPLPKTDAYLVTDPAIGFGIYDFSKGPSVAAQSTIYPINNQTANCWSTFSPRTGNSYLIDVGTATVNEVNVDSSLKAKVVNQYTFVPRSGMIDSIVASVGSNDFLYVLAANASTIDVLSLNAPGKASVSQKFDFHSAVSSKVTFNPLNLQGMAAYVVGK